LRVEYVENLEGLTGLSQTVYGAKEYRSLANGSQCILKM
jgi:hypothetical protein